MKDIKKILLPVDLSESAEKLVPMAKRLATAFEAAIDLLFVVRDFTQCHKLKPFVYNLSRIYASLFCDYGDTFDPAESVPL